MSTKLLKAVYNTLFVFSFFLAVASIITNMLFITGNSVGVFYNLFAYSTFVSKIIVYILSFINARKQNEAKAKVSKQYAFIHFIDALVVLLWALTWYFTRLSFA